MSRCLGKGQQLGAKQRSANPGWFLQHGAGPLVCVQQQISLEQPLSLLPLRWPRLV